MGVQKNFRGDLPWMMPWKFDYKFIEENRALEIYKFIKAS